MKSEEDMMLEEKVGTQKKNLKKCWQFGTQRSNKQDKSYLVQRQSFVLRV